MFGIHLPSLSDVKGAVTGAASTALHTTEDLGSAAGSHAASLGREGLDLGRSAVTAVSHIDVQKAAGAVTGAIGHAQSWAEHGIEHGVTAAGGAIHGAADYARSHITGSDPLSRMARGAITASEDVSRFDVGLVGGVAKAATGLVGSVGHLSVLAAEYQVSPGARATLDSKISGALEGGARAVGGYVSSVAHDPSRVGGDLSGAARAGAGWVGGEVRSAEQAIHDGHGPESFGMQVGNAATYLIPVGGEARLAAGGAELAARGAAEALAEGGTRVAAETGTRAVAEGGARVATEAAPRTIPAISDLARAGVPGAAERTGLTEGRVTEILETPKGARPAPESYLPSGYEAAHLAQWNEGAVRFTSRTTFAERGTLGPPQGFTIPASRFDALIKSTGGDVGAIERKLGLDPGYLSDADTMIVHVERGDIQNLHIPSGNEGGANPNWLPGGYTSGGEAEAVMDFPKGTPYAEIHLSGTGR